jgi:hypothetical protein
MDLWPFERHFDSRFRRIDSVPCDARQFLETLARQAVDKDGLAQYAAQCPVAGTEPDDYAPRLIQLAPNCAVVAGIHFRGSRLDFPFVDISAQSAPLPLAKALQTLTHNFRSFQPRAVRLWRAAQERPPEACHDDLVIVAASLREVLAAPAAHNAERIRLELDPAVTSYGDYRLLYDALHSGAPELARLVSPETFESLCECAQRKAFFRVFVDDQCAGFVAARPDTYRQWKGWIVVEEVLHPDFRGKGFAAAVQQALLKKLDDRIEQVVFGTIASENLPSLKTAKRVGRQVVEVGGFVYLDSPAATFTAAGG